MLIAPGHWVGKGSLLLEGVSLGQTVGLDLTVGEESDCIVVSGSLNVQDKPEAELSIRIVPNEVGTYTLDVFLLGARLDGSGKLDSEPNLSLLWNEAGTINASVALFKVASGVGCRGFVREREATYTWEVALTSKVEAVGGDNVVSLARRRRR